MSHYDTLGVNKSASAEDIKKAYRKLAMKHHPDRNGGDETNFKKIQEAYETLSDPNKKAEYDNPSVRFSNSSFNMHGDINDIFRDIFGQQRQQRPAKNPDTLVNVEISLLDAYTGTNFILDTQSGPVNLKIPAGVQAGTKLRIPNKGTQRFPQLPPGDLYVAVYIAKDSEWGRQQDDLYIKVEIDAITAMVGTTVEIEHLTKKRYKVNIPAGVQPDEKIRLKGLGMPNPQTGVVGNLYVLVCITIPKITDHNHIESLNNIRKEINERKTS